MNPDKQAAIAYIAALSRNRNISSVYDYCRNKFCIFSNSDSNGNINVYDSSRNSFIVGNLPTVYDYATNTIIQIDVRNGVVSGYDFEASVFFTGNVLDTMVSLFVNGQYYNYSFL